MPNQIWHIWHIFSHNKKTSPMPLSTKWCFGDYELWMLCLCVFQPVNVIALDVLIRAKVFVISYGRITCEQYNPWRRHRENVLHACPQQMWSGAIFKSFELKMVKYEPSTHSHLFYSVALYVFSYFIDVSISSHCTVAAAHPRATEAVAGFSFGVRVGGGAGFQGP